MEIPNTLPQFENTRALFVVTGEFEGKFFLLQKGTIEEKQPLILNPREEAKEKQAFVGKKGGMQSLSSVSHHGPYIMDLKNRFYREIGEMLDKLMDKEKIDELYIFIPEYAKNKIIERFPIIALEKNKGVYTGEYTKHNPLELLEMVQEKHISDIENKKPLYFSKEEETISKKQRTRPAQ